MLQGQQEEVMSGKEKVKKHETDKKGGGEKKTQAHGHKDKVTLTAEELKVLTDKISELEALKDNMVRTAADFENAKKRLARDREEFLKFGQQSLIQNLLPVLDNFERAMVHTDSQEDQLKGLAAGIQMVYKQMMDALKAQGLKRIVCVGEPFDPHQHEAVTHVREEGPEDVVIEEIQPGYFLHDRLLRASKVSVRVAPEAKEQTDSSEEGGKQEDGNS